MSNKQLTIWNEAERAMPNCVARSALFNVDNIRSAGKRQVMRDMPVSTGRPVAITYTGEQLRQDDADVWLQLVHMSRDDLDRPVSFTCYSMLKVLSWSDCAGSRKRLIAVIRRLQWTQITVADLSDTRAIGYCGPLIFDFMTEQQLMEQKVWSVRLNHRLSDLFLPAGYTRLDWETRKALSPLGKWLHTYFLSHRVHYPVSFAWLHTLSGSNCASPKKWRDQVLAVLPDLQSLGIIKTYSIESDGRLWAKR